MQQLSARKIPYSTSMIRQIIRIDEDLCNGCGLCAKACHEGAIGMIDGKATLLRDDYCDGLGNCLPVCPTGAISFEEREAAAYDEEAVLQNMEKAKNQAIHKPVFAPVSCGCPGSAAKSLRTEQKAAAPVNAPRSNTERTSELRQWPVQLKLVPVNAPYFDGAHLLIAADCAAYAYANFHEDFIRNKITVIGCPKLDNGDYTEKLAAIIAENDIKSVTIVRMEVPCCGGLAHAATEALKASGKFLPWQIVTISTEGERLD